MTAEPDLLPLPSGNVAHATAAKDAEIEALRAEVDLRDSIIATHAADTREYQKQISQAEARAERLAEALRDAADDLERGIDARIVVAQARAELRDHDQEDRNDR